MAIDIRTDPAGGALRIEGEMTVQHAAEFKQALLAGVAEGRETLLDLSGVGEMDSAGLQLLALARWEAARRGGSLRLAGCSAAVLELLELYGMSAAFGDPEAESTVAAI